ncbi:hypothetical protein HELRODRAFT_171464 [Helobdella robusta]|uniref:Transcription initiation factor TFIID subunit 8 n=1 Tax=Helobdella robusta TaxID=6412 RepID=T1F4B4_HELRO|nr:hypothetical protein HELRODRAFT_171464 [Helobdella robusta]ESO05792.1 hypothetical protein HELRODRAFT_171464 [Helobdella robusta]
MSDFASFHQKIFKNAIARILFEVGCDKASEQCLSVLMELLGCYLYELGRSTKAVAELAGRTEPLLTDVIIALAEMGQNANDVVTFGRRSTQLPFNKLQFSSSLSDGKRLQVGTPESHPYHIPDYLPHFPDPHTYIKTLTYKPPVTEYQIIREKMAVQKMDTEQALTKFIAKTGNTENLFSDDPYAFPLIANKLKASPYYEALMPREEDLNDDEIFPVAEESSDKSKNNLIGSDPLKQSQQFSTKIKSNGESGYDIPIDNPYLRPIKMPKIKLNLQT